MPEPEDAVLPHPSNEADFRLGQRLAFGAAPLGFILLLGLVTLWDPGPEMATVLLAGYWLLVGLTQWICLLPAVVVALLAKRPRLAWGLVRGGSHVTGLNVAAWGLGYFFATR